MSISKRLAPPRAREAPAPPVITAWTMLRRDVVAPAVTEKASQDRAAPSGSRDADLSAYVQRRYRSVSVRSRPISGFVAPRLSWRALDRVRSAIRGTAKR